MRRVGYFKTPNPISFHIFIRIHIHFIFSLIRIRFQTIHFMFILKLIRIPNIYFNILNITYFQMFAPVICSGSATLEVVWSLRFSKVGAKIIDSCFNSTLRNRNPLSTPGRSTGNARCPSS